MRCTLNSDQDSFTILPGGGFAGMTEDLKPCPFCGSDDVRHVTLMVRCNTCCADGPVSATRETAVMLWNMRETVGGEAIAEILRLARHHLIGRDYQSQPFNNDDWCNSQHDPACPARLKLECGECMREIVEGKHRVPSA